MRQKKIIPNILTITRGIFAITIIVLFLLDFDRFDTLIWLLFIIASLTDFFDGYLARKWHAVSNFGKVADPLLDKILIFSLFALIFNSHIVPQAFIITLISRDLFIGLLQSRLIKRGIIVAAIMSAKIKTTFQMLMINFVLLALIFPQFHTLQKAALATGVIAVTMSLWSASIYIKIFYNSLRETK